MHPGAKRILSNGRGVYVTPILWPKTTVANLTKVLAIYAYLPMNPCCLPQPTPTNLVFLTDASGKSALTPITGRGTLQLTHTEGHYHMDHHTGHTTYGASSHGELGAIADPIAKIAAPLPALPQHRMGLVRSGRHCLRTPTPPHITTATPQRHRNEPRDPSTASLESPPQPPPPPPPMSNFTS